MSAVKVIDKSGQTVGSVDVPAAFSAPPNLHLLHMSVMRQLANRRAGTADTKRRDDVRGGGRKPWRQKGTGRARQGSIRSPQWRKGGVVFGPHPRSFAIGLSKKSRRAALAQALGAKIADGSLSVLDAAGLAPSKTKDFIAFVWPKDGARDRVLLAVHREKDDGARALELSGRNAAGATVVGHDEVTVYALLGHERIILTKPAFEALVEVCGA